MRKLGALLLVAFVIPCVSAGAQTEKPSLPDPIKFFNKRDMVMRATRAVFEQLGYKIELEDPQAGKLVTRPYEFISGALTSSEIDKVAVKSSGLTGTWLRAEYTVEALLEATSPSETMITVRTQMQGLNRNAAGTEEWIPLQSLGTVEKRVLGKISMKLLGFEPEFKEKKGFWDQKPTSPTKVKKRPAP